VKTHLVREDERKFYFVSCFGIPATAQGERTWGTSSNGGDETERRHCWAGAGRFVTSRVTKAAYAFGRQKDLGNGYRNQDPGRALNPQPSADGPRPLSLSTRCWCSAFGTLNIYILMFSFYFRSTVNPFS
jgi:hypothetical protein